MSEQKKNVVRIELTDEQKAKIKEATGQDAQAVELSAEELEERIAPRSLM
jgi:hypothetical protein